MNSPINVLLVEDNSDDAFLIQRMVSDAPGRDFAGERVETLAEALVALANKTFDVVLLDLDLPDSNGFETLHRLRDAHSDVPIVILTGVEDNDLAIQTIEAGAQDFVSKNELTGQSLCRVICHSMARHQKLRQYEDAARTDGLTGVANRRLFEIEMRRQLSIWRRHQVSFSLLLIDIDHFKEFNDAHGHLVGDQVLRDVAQVLSRSVRESDLVTRYGGEEFALILPSTIYEGAHVAAERSRLAVLSHVCEFNGQQFQVTASVGVSAVALDDDQSTLVKRADDALYAAKSAGRNCCFANNGRTNEYIELMDALRKFHKHVIEL